MNCSQQQLWNQHAHEQQWNAKNLNGSNMSLNLPYYPPHQYDMNGTMWINNGSYRKPDGYPYNFGMMPNGKRKKRMKTKFNIQAYKTIKF